MSRHSYDLRGGRGLSVRSPGAPPPYTPPGLDTMSPAARARAQAVEARVAAKPQDDAARAGAWAAEQAAIAADPEVVAAEAAKTAAWAALDASKSTDAYALGRAAIAASGLHADACSRARVRYRAAMLAARGAL